ncbi:hypothetical protein MAR_037042, partial [Mya arenaria]
MDHLYYKSHDQFPGFQVITSRCGPDHSYSTSTSSIQTPPKRYLEKRKRGSVTPTGKTPQQLSKKTTFEETRHVSWTKEEKAYLQTYSKRPRNGVSETAFWKDCAEAMGVLFPGKSR